MGKDAAAPKELATMITTRHLLITGIYLGLWGAGQAQSTPDGSIAKPFIVHTDIEHDRLPVGAFFRDERPFGHEMLKQKVWPLGAVNKPAPEVRRATPVEVRRAIPAGSQDRP
jgi:hypothetical protein